eukprot:1157836-Pelagomonas_calceolata.AAC.9
MGWVEAGRIADQAHVDGSPVGQHLGAPDGSRVGEEAAHTRDLHGRSGHEQICVQSGSLCHTHTRSRAYKHAHKHTHAQTQTAMARRPAIRKTQP